MAAWTPFRGLALATTAAVVSLFLVVGTPNVAAAAAEDPAANEAKKHYEEGTKAFNLGEYPRAIAEFKATYNAKPDPLLLYNIAQSYRLAGDPGQALFFYKSFLRNMPTATNRKEVEGRIKVLEKQVAEQKREPGGAVVAAPAPAVVVPPETATTMTTPPPPPPAAPPTPLPNPNAAALAPAPGAEPGWGTGLPKAAPSAPPPMQTPTGAHVDLTTPAPSPEEPSRPIYKKWWFWAGTAAVVVVVGVLAAANAKQGPNTALGTYDPAFKP